MKLMIKVSFALAMLTVFSIHAEDAEMKMSKPLKEHQWLQRLAGEWLTESEMMMGPNAPLVKAKGTETVRVIGGFWAHCENKGEIMGAPFTGILTIGYDAEKKTYVAHWIDSMSSKMWQYKTSLDAAEKVLTLETEGPCPMQGGKIAKMKETLELKDADTKVLKSTVEIDGKWVTVLTVNYTRKK